MCGHKATIYYERVADRHILAYCLSCHREGGWQFNKVDAAQDMRLFGRRPDAPPGQSEIFTA
jgi:hypothetical protein